MNITFQIDIENEDKAVLAHALDCAVNEVEAKLQAHARASLEEYVQLYLGRRVFSRGSDILEHRLALLIEHAYEGKVPPEGEIAALFQITLPQARSLVRSTLSKYRSQLRDATEKTVKSLLETAIWQNNDAEVWIEIPAANVVDLMNQALVRRDRGAAGVKRHKDAIATYVVTKVAYAVLCAEFKATPVAP